MNKKAFEIYQYAVPAVLTPLSFWLWWKTYEGNLWLTLVAWLIPIAYAYIVPGIGTNILKVWEFNTRFRLGRFRPHHGFVFGSATAMVAWLCHTGMAMDVYDVIILSVTLACVLGVLNFYYDIKALDSGILRVYNQPWAEGKGSVAITLDYAPWFFAGFGAIYGAGVGIAELLAVQGWLNADTFLSVFFLVLICAICIPVTGYCLYSLMRYGHSGCRPVKRELA